jgi:hypothetical protein
MSNIVIILDGHTLPMPDVPFTRPLEPNEADVVTLDGTLYTDFTNYRRVWNLHWGRLSVDDYQVVEDIFTGQYASGAYPLLQIDYYGVSVPVKVTMNPKNIRKDGCYMVDVEVTLMEQYAIS